MNTVASNNGANIAIIQDANIGTFRLPSHWIPVARWEVNFRPFVDHFYVGYSPRTTFFAINPDYEERLLANLVEYETQLPESVQVTYLSQNLPGERVIGDVNFGNDVYLESWQLQSDIEFQPCDTISLSSWWQQINAHNNLYSLSLVIVRNGEAFAQYDGAVSNTPSSTWVENTTYFDVRHVELPCNLSEGQYDLLLTLYDSSTLETEIAVTSSGEQIGEYYYLTTINVTE